MGTSTQIFNQELRGLKVVKVRDEVHLKELIKSEMAEHGKARIC